MRTDRLATLLCAGTLGRAGFLDRAGATAVLMYHSVSSACDERGVRPYYRLATSPARFREQMSLLSDLGYRACSLEQALGTAGGGTHHERQVVLTFDDGYLDFLSDAWPTLQRYRFTATVFLPTAFVGETRRCFKGRRCLTWSEVRDLSREGVSFGSHTVTHPVLHTLSWSGIRSELRDSRNQIEDAVGSAVATFAYPFAFPQSDGPFVSRFREELAQCGYGAAVTTVIGRHVPGEDRLRMKRLPVNDADDLRLFTAKLGGAYDWLGAVQSAWKRARGRRYGGRRHLTNRSTLDEIP